MGSLSEAIESVTTMDIVEAFGVPNRTRRGRVYLLCPGHDDNHFGSCYIDKNDNGYYCYVCGKHVGKWDMVLQLNGDNKAEAAKWFFNASGITPDDERHEDPLRSVNVIIKKISEYINNSPVYSDLYECDKIDSSYGRIKHGNYVYSELAIHNPLLELYKADKKAFKFVAIKQLRAKIALLDGMRAKYENTSKCIFVDTIGPMPLKMLIEACTKRKTEINDLIVSIKSL